MCEGEENERGEWERGMREGEENERIIRERETEGVAHLFRLHTADAGKQGLQMRDARQVEVRALRVLGLGKRRKEWDGR
jgi:hypothetical protein